MPAALPLLSRSPTATIAGIVRDAQGPIIPNVRVTATSGAARQKTTSATNENGLFSFPQLPIGQYVVDAEKSGFRRFARNGLVLITGQDLELDIVLEAGVVSESVTISGTATLLETRTSDVSQLVDAKAVEISRSFNSTQYHFCFGLDLGEVAAIVARLINRYPVEGHVTSSSM